MRKKAIGATAFGLMNITFGLIGLSASVLSFFTERPFIAYAAPLQIIIGVGLIALKEWARKAALFFYIFFILIMLPISLIYETRSVIISDKLPQWLLAFAMVWFFLRPSVRQQFKSS